MKNEKLIDYKDKKVECDIVQIVDRKVYLSDCSVNGTKVDYEYGKILIPGILVDDADSDGKISIGDKYTYKVNDNNTYNFYVLSFNEDDTVNLIMDRNICVNGTTNYKQDNNYCQYPWNHEKNNNYGPDRAMLRIYNGTKDWTNVPDMVMNYHDENNTSSDTLGYTSIITNTSTKATTITGKPTSNTTTVGTTALPLKARLPMMSEVTGAGCTTADYGSCPAWLTNALQIHSNYLENEHIKGIYGYWLLSSTSDIYYAASIVYLNGKLDDDGTFRRYGVRPVITVTKVLLSN